jgi:hypothetical protein
LNFITHNSAKRAFKTLMVIGLLSFLMLCATPAAHSQNTKGDRAEVGGNSGPRKSRFKGKSSKRKTVKKSFNRVVANKYSLANSSRSFKHPRKPSGGEKAISSRNNPYVNNSERKPSSKQRAWRGTSSGSRLVVRSRTGKTKNVFPHGQYLNNSSKTPRSTQRPVSNRGELARLNRLQGSPKSHPPGRKRKVVPRSASSSYIRHRTINSNAGFWNVKKKGEVAVTRDLAGRPLRTKNYQTPSIGVIASPKPYARRKRIGSDHPYKGSYGGGRRIGSQPSTSQRAWQGDIAKRRIRGRNFTSKSAVEGNPTFGPRRSKPHVRDRVYKGSMPYGYSSASKASEKRTGKAPLPARVPGIGASGLGRYQGNIKGGRPLKGGGSRSGKLWNNRQTALNPRVPGIGANGVGTFQGNLKGRRPLKGGGSRSGKLWNNGQTALNPRVPGIGANGVGTFQGNIKGNRPPKGGGSRSGRLWNNRESPLGPRVPGIGANGVGTFQGNIKGNRPAKGGGSRSGRLWNNGERALSPRVPGIGANGVGTFQGNIKGSRPLKGGGSRSGRLWNNGERALAPRVPGIGANGVGTFQGNIKARRTPKGGGSISGRHWNNMETPLGPRVPGIGANGIGKFQGNIKTGRPLKGGGSVSGRLWNNKESAIPVRPPSANGMKAGGYPGHIKRYSLSPGFSNQGEEFTGYIKAKKPAKGGGSVSGKLWNNKETHIPGHPPSETAMRAGRYQGNLKRYEETPGFNNQGEEFTGYKRLPRFKKGYIQNPNSAKESTLKKRPDKTTYQVSDLQVKVKRRDYLVNKNSSEDALKKLEPTDATKRVGNLQIAVQRRRYVVNKNSSEDALKKLAPTDATKSVSNLQIKVKQYNYIHNPSSAHDALGVREPGKAFAKATDYQGNIRMKKFDLTKLFSEKNRELHPDAKFVKINKNNVDEERDLLTNIKLWWAKTFRKNDTQPKNLKEREKKPRYDKGEQGLWNE